MRKREFVGVSTAIGVSVPSLGGSHIAKEKAADS